MKFGKVLYYTLIVILLAVLVFSGTQVAGYVVDAMHQKDSYDELAQLVSQSRTETLPSTEPPFELTPPPSEAAVISTEPIAPTEPVILSEYAPVYEKNSDTVGWLLIDGTPINYPVMQTPDREDYYLKRNFNKEKNAHGCLYVRETCDVFTPSDNVTIYGHHMKDGSMFSSLKRFRTKSFWEEHHSINFDTLYERHTYTVFAVFTTTASVGEGFAYHRFENAKDEADFDDFISSCKELSLYDTGITPKYGDKIICLSTCEYSQTNGRLVVAAVRNPEAPSEHFE